jgi:tetratricopeptide (TPR) repeat protein
LTTSNNIRYKGNALANLKRHEEAVAAYDRALDIDNGLAYAWFNKGDELGHLSRFIEAKACFENALTLGLWQAKGIIMKCEHVLESEWYA